jgi:hypothetical protein
LRVVLLGALGGGGTLDQTNSSQGSVSEEILNPAEPSAGQSEGLPLFSRLSVFLSEILDSFSFLFFCLPFSSLTHLLTSWCSRFLAEE